MGNPARLGQDCVPREEQEGEGGIEDGDPDSGKVSFLFTPEARV